MSEQTDFTDSSFRENMNFIRTIFDQPLSSSSENQSDSWSQSLNVDKNMNMMGSFNALCDMANRETGMTPTPTNASAVYKSPRIDVETPRANLYSRHSNHSTPSAQSPHSGDTSGISSGTDVSSDGSSPYRAITNKNWNCASLTKTPVSPNSKNTSSSYCCSPNKSSLASSQSEIVSPFASALLQQQSSPLKQSPQTSSNICSSSQEGRGAANLPSCTSTTTTTTNDAFNIADFSELSGINANLLNPNLQQQLLNYNNQQIDKQILSNILTILNNNNNNVLSSSLDNDYLGLGSNSLTSNLISSMSAEDICQLYNRDLLLRLLSTPSLSPLLAGSSQNSVLDPTTALSASAAIDPTLNFNSIFNLPTTTTADISSCLLDPFYQTSSSSSSSNNNIFNTSGSDDPILSPSALKQFGLLGGAESLGLNLSLGEDVQQIAQAYRTLMPSYLGDIEKAASLYRSSANCISQKNEVQFHWSGTLPNRVYSNAIFSRKVFLGGVPWDSTSDDLVAAFSRFGPVNVLWPQKEGHSSTFGRTPPPKGYCYLLFENENSVRLLLTSCSKDAHGSDYFKIASVKFRSKDVQVIPWVINDSQFTKVATQKPDNKRTVFIGALHGMITAETLANIMDDLFGGVTFAAIDTDKYKYPIGSGRVSFSNTKSYIRAVTANFVDIRTPKFSKTIQIDPYLEDARCRNCVVQPGVYFCRSFECFRYFCPACWKAWHSSASALCNHKPLRRTFKPIASSPQSFNF